jgi:hypothetical protein
VPVCGGREASQHQRRQRARHHLFEMNHGAPSRREPRMASA